MNRPQASSLILSLIAIGAINITSLSQVNATKSQIEEPTLQTGVLTGKQKHHSKLYKEYRMDKKIPEKLAKYDNDFGMTNCTFDGTTALKAVDAASR